MKQKVLFWLGAMLTVFMLFSCSDFMNSLGSGNSNQNPNNPNPDTPQPDNPKPDNPTPGNPNTPDWKYPTSTPSTTWSGTGYSDDPYIISTAQQLADLAYLVNNGNSYSYKYFALDCDIDLNADGFETNWIPIGDYGDNKFSGNFDGKMHTISGINIKNTERQVAGLFGYLDGGSIKNLIIGSGSIENSFSNSDYISFTGAIAGKIQNGTVISSCANEGATVSATEDTALVGGLIGMSIDCKIYNSYNHAEVYVSSYSDGYAGGIVGGTDDTEISNCYNIGYISSYDDANKGQIVSYVFKTTTIQYCYYQGDTNTLYSSNSDTDIPTVTLCAAFNTTSDKITGITTAPLLTNLNTFVNRTPAYGASLKKWAKDSEGYPVFADSSYSTGVTEDDDVPADIPDDGKTWVYPEKTPAITWTGKGTSTEPYKITTPQQLANLAFMVNDTDNGTSYEGKYFELDADIDLNYGKTIIGNDSTAKEWTPIGLFGDTPFSGYFDGKLHTIKGLYIRSDKHQVAGLFGNLKGAHISNIIMTDGFIQNSFSSTKYTSWTGAIAAAAKDSTEITSCGNEGVQIYASASNVYAAGIVGLLDKSKVINSYNKALVKTSVSNTTVNSGGIVGAAQESEISNCINFYAKTLEQTYTGNVLGKAYKSVTINYCYYFTYGYDNSGYTENTTGSVTGEHPCTEFRALTDVIESYITGTPLRNLNAWVSAQETPYTSWVKTQNGDSLTFAGSTNASDDDGIDRWAYPTTNPSTTWTGSGTESNPYVITTAQQLADLAYKVNNGASYSGLYFELGNDIDLNDGKTITTADATANKWTPIGKNYSYTFKGTFDGKGHKINGLYIDATDEYYVGLFGYVERGTVKNLILGNGCIQNSNMTRSGTTYYAGAITGCLYRGYIISCGNEGTSVTVSTDSSSTFYIGGLAGYLFSYVDYNISNSYNNAKVTANNTDSALRVELGGICGRIYGGGVHTCYSSGNLIMSGTGKTNNYSGGIAGFAEYTDSQPKPKFTNCYHYGYDETTNGTGDNTSFTITNCARFSSPTASISGGLVTGRLYLQLEAGLDKINADSSLGIEVDSEVSWTEGDSGTYPFLKFATARSFNF